MSTIRRLLYFPFWLAVLFSILGYVITFCPGAECEWFLIVAGLSIAGLFIPKKPYQIAAALLLLFALTQAYIGYQRGIEYNKRLSSEHSAP